MIHTDGKPTICTVGPIPGLDDNETKAVEQLARDLAAVWHVSPSEARDRILTAMGPSEAARYAKLIDESSFE